MAKLGRSFVVIRFGFGTGNVKGRQRFENTYRYAVKRVAISFADGEYNEIKGKLTRGLEADIQRELINMASLYRRHIIGANGNTSTPAGVLRSAIGGAQPLALAAALPPWAPRSAEYLHRKFYNTKSRDWFDNRKWTGRGAPKDSGLLFREMRADVWEKMFGPISVSFTRDNIASEPLVKFDAGGTHANVQIGRLTVRALGKLTPAMLPALGPRGKGNIPIASERGNPGLMKLVQDYDQRLAYRLGQKSTITKRYRPTLEPFLSYFLTRSIPAAVTRRIGQGSLAAIRRSS